MTCHTNCTQTLTVRVEEPDTSLAETVKESLYLGTLHSLFCREWLR